MKSRNSEYFEVKVRYAKNQEDGTQKMETEMYVVDALSFTEAEARITKEITPCITGDFKIISITRASYSEVVTSEDSKADKYYKTKVAFLTYDEKTGKEKRNIGVYLVQAASLDNAKSNLDAFFGHSMLDWVKVAVVETRILDVYFHKVG